MSLPTMRKRFLLLACLLPMSLMGQFQDDFSDGDFTQNPVWTGETVFFQVNAALELQSQGPAATETLHLRTAQGRVADTEWRFDLRYAFPPSGANQMRVYLVSDQPDLEGSLQGYFVEVGEGGSNDTYRLFRQDGLATTPLITGTLGLAASGVDATLLITRDAAGTWSMGVDTDGSGQFVGQGMAVDATYLSSAWGGVWVRHTSTRADDFFFDNFYVGVPIQDSLPPVLTGLDILDPQTLRLTFSEPLLGASAQSPANYALSGGIGNPQTAIWSAAQPAEVSLSLGTPLADGNTYALTVSNLSDTAGNVMAVQDTTFLYDIPDLPVPGDVVIHELMADPTPSAGLPEVEYWELYNASAKTFDLAGWTVSNGSVTSALPAHTLGPGGFVLLVRNSDQSLMSGFGPVLGLAPWVSLVNTGDNLGLRSSQGLLIDTLDYTDDWYGNPAKAEGGYALERIDPNPLSCPPVTNWAASVAAVGGTPGAPNSVFNPNPTLVPPRILSARVVTPNTVRLCLDQSMDPVSLVDPVHYQLDPATVTVVAAQGEAPDLSCVTLSLSGPLPAGSLFELRVSGLSGCRGQAMLPDTVTIARGESPQAGQLIINELMPDPSPPQGLPEAEFVELYNRSAAILELDQLQLSDGGSPVRLLPRILPAGGYLILCAEADSAAFAGLGPIMALPFLPTLNNSGDSLFLRGPFAEPLDAVYYRESWYQDEDKAAGGWSLERRDPDLTSCQLAANWGASLDARGGTPGQANSLLGSPVEAPPLAVATWFWTGPDQLSLIFNQPLDPLLAGLANTYLLQNGPPIAAATLIGEAQVRLVLGAAVDSGETYTLTAPELRSCLGDAWGDSLRLGVPVPLTPFALRINEIMADPVPAQGLPEVEYIELYNPGEQWLSLDELYISDGGNPLWLGPGAIEPGGYLLLCRESDAAALAAYGPVLGVSGFPALGNALDSLYLFGGFELIDQVFYAESWWRDSEKQAGGWSLERIDPALAACDHSANWRASTDPSGGTPGRANSVAGLFAESSPPRLLAVTVPEENVVSFLFDEPLDAAAVYDLDNYDLSGSPGFLVLIELAPGGRGLTFTYDAALEPGLLYPLVFKGLPGCNGGLIEEEVFVGLPLPAEAGDVLIHEILFNPYSGGSDFVEIINVSDKVIDLSTLRLGEGWPDTDSIYNDHPLSQDPIQLLPRQILCLTEDVAIQQQTYLPPGDARFLEMDDFPSYDDREGSCVLFTGGRLVLDRLDYLDDWQFPTLESEDGVSLERLSTLQPTQSADNWRSAAQTVRFATPGYPNSQRSAPG
ncbi:MAG: hypothetical protein D6722_20620, partial [Bacteroidetes bacterium]